MAKGFMEETMNKDVKSRLMVAALIYAIVNAVVFGAGMIVVLVTPALSQYAFFWVSAVVVSSFVISLPLAWFIAPLMMMRFMQVRRIP